jgi:uncharacterized membrane protein (DUF106 family)
MEDSSTSISTASLLGVAFVILKLTGVIDWSWWYVTMPFWLGVAVYAVLLTLDRLLTKKEVEVDREISKERKKKSKFQERLEEMERARRGYSKN